MKKLQKIFLLTLTAVTITACSTQKTENNNTNQQVNTEKKAENKKSAFDFTVLDINNKEVKLNDFKGKKVYINMWASWCGPCLHEIPELEKTFQSLKNREDIVFLSITSPSDELFSNRNPADKTKEIILQKANELGISYPVLFDTKDTFINNYSIRAFPTHVFINSDGTINKQVPGIMNEQTLLSNINDLK